MRTSVLALAAAAALAAVLAVAGCGTTSEPPDETAGWSAQRLYGEAKDAMASNDWPRAIRYLEKLEARYPYGRYAQQAQLDVAYAHWKFDERAAAIAAADRFIKLYPNHRHVDYIYYLKGLVNFNGNIGFFGGQDPTERDPKGMQESFEAFRTLVTRFPDSPYAEDARQRMNWLVNALASHEIHVARYYLRRGAYLAAANRAQDVVKTYREAPAIEEALAIMAVAYDKLGLPELSSDARRVLQQNYKEDAAPSRVATEPASPWWQLW